MIINSGITFGSGIVFSAPPHGNPYGVFAFGSNNSSGFINTKNLVSDTGVLAGDSTGAGTSRAGLAACGYGTDKGIFAYGSIPLPPYSSQPVAVSNLLSNTGVIATDTSGVGVARWDPAACTYGTDKGIFAYGSISGGTMINTISRVSNTGVIAGDATGSGTVRYRLAACGYGTDKGIFGYGYTLNSYSVLSMTNLVSNTGTIATDTTGVGTARYLLAACSYGGDKGVFAFGGTLTGVTQYVNRVSNTGVVSTDETVTNTIRQSVSSSTFGVDKGIFGFGQLTSSLTQSSTTTIVSSTGVFASDVTSTGVVREGTAGVGYSYT